jgi:two-component system, chemotaxis family, protein-glutamate methylesterase/glutaminase
MPSHKAIRILVADDSPVVREALTQLIDAHPDMVVVGYAANGPEAVRETRRLRPDLVTMDVYMPGIDGVEATREIMRSVPTPIVIVTTASLGPDSAVTFQAIDAGAVDVLPKPSGSRLKTPEQRRAFVRQLRVAAGVGVVGRRANVRSAPPSNPVKPTACDGERVTPIIPLHAFESRGQMSSLSMIVIGASTGGPPCLRVLLSALDPERAPPVLVVQHMPADFIPGLADWLDDAVACHVKVARPGDLPEPGTVYIASGNAHMKISQGGRLLVEEGPLVHYQCPSVDVLFDSVAQTRGVDTAGVLLTGMGSDGADGLLHMRHAGCWTFAQDEASSVVYGMPGEAAKRGAARYIANPVHLGRLLAGARFAARADERSAVGRDTRATNDRSAT